LTQDIPPLRFDALAAQDALERGCYRQAAALLRGAPPGDAVAWRLLGQAYLRSGRTLEAELPLRRSLALGDPEARLAYGNWLRIIGQFGAAVRELQGAALLGGELGCLALVSQGVAQFRLGDPRAGLSACRAGLESYPPQAAPYRRARVARVLGQMHLYLGELSAAYGYQAQVAAALQADPEPVSRFLGLRDLGRVQVRLGQTPEARGSFQAAVQILGAGAYAESDTPRVQALRQGAEAELLALEAEPGQSQRQRTELLLDLYLQTSALHDSELRLWTVQQLAEALSRQGRHAQAMHTLYGLGTTKGLPPVLSVWRGLLMRRQRQYPQAIRDLESAGSILDADPLLYWRAQLHLADALYQERQQGEGLRRLTLALRHLITQEDQRYLQADWQELGELVQHALLEPDLAPLMEALLAPGDEGASLEHPAPHQAAFPRLEVRLLGPATVWLDGQLCMLSAGAALLLGYLHLSPDHSRNDLIAVLFPDFGKVETTTFFRLAVRELRAALGPDILRLDDTLRHPRYRIGAFAVDLDLVALRRALALGDLDAALELYRGPLLSEMDPASDWADGLSGELRLTLNLELQECLNAARSGPALRRALKLVRRCQDADPEVAEAAPELAQAVHDAHRRLGSLGQ
jgi:tetratricopeptide (TPR) repeat protein